jgi:glycosyltransferase involved in cell wall biosynthesis
MSSDASRMNNSTNLLEEWKAVRRLRGEGWPRRVAIVHYWLIASRGGERVIERLLKLFPNADVYTHVYNPDAVSEAIRRRNVRTSFISKLPWARRYYQKYLPMMPLALEQLDFSGYDLVISSESGPAKGIITGPDTLHVCYVHSPMRYLWDHYHRYRASAGLVARTLMPWIFHRLRIWDYASAGRIDVVLANSDFIRRRIAKAWNRSASVLYPPVEIDQFSPGPNVSDRYLWVGQMTPYKRADIAVEAFNEIGLPLLMVGDGEMSAAVRRRKKDNIEIVAKLSLPDLKRAYSECKALIFTAEEDFGIVAVETIASGRPVLAFGRGGIREIVVEGVSGLFFDEQTPKSLIDGVRRLEQWLETFRPTEAVDTIKRFAPVHFDRGFLRALTQSDRTSER